MSCVDLYLSCVDLYLSCVDLYLSCVDLYLFLCEHVTRRNLSYNRREKRRRKKRDGEMCRKGEGKGGRGKVAQS